MKDDRITCSDCARFNADDYTEKHFGQTYTFRGHCMAARPPLARISDVKHRCEYFNAHNGVEDQRKGIERWPELKDYPGGPGRKPYPQRKEK